MYAAIFLPSDSCDLGCPRPDFNCFPLELQIRLFFRETGEKVCGLAGIRRRDERRGPHIK